MQTLFAWWELHWRLWVKQADAVCITLKEVNRSMSVTHATVHCNSNIPHNRERRQWGAIFSVSYTLNLRKPSYCGCLYDQRRQTRNSCNVKSTLPFLWPILLLWKNKIKTLFITVGKTAGSSFFLVLTKTGVLSIFGRLMKYAWLCNQLRPLKLKPNVTVVAFKLQGMDSSWLFSALRFQNRWQPSISVSNSETKHFTAVFPGKKKEKKWRLMFEMMN